MPDCTSQSKPHIGPRHGYHEPWMQRGGPFAQGRKQLGTSFVVAHVLASMLFTGIAVETVATSARAKTSATVKNTKRSRPAHAFGIQTQRDVSASKRSQHAQ
ncbi:hypothetical protein MTO96_006873 [Rhipicephalus appendiculatus]